MDKPLFLDTRRTLLMPATMLRWLALAACAFGFILTTDGGQARADQANARSVPLLVALGDSLTSGYGLNLEESLPAQLERYLKAKGVKVSIRNAGVSGDTTAGGLTRLKWVLADRPDAVLLALGANDALRGLDPKGVRANLDAILAKLRAQRVKVLLAGMRAPANYGAQYAQEFDRIYPELAGKHGVLLYPFLLDGVALHPELNQADGIHPTATGVARIVEKLAPHVIELLSAPTP
jgi:acyl-CoA thioesterase-1